jgi:phosphoesterase RecJ-like protein
MIKEENPREFKISLRSSSYVNVAEIAAGFGGGGHIHAAGCTFTPEPGLDKPEEYIEKLLIEKIESAL